MSLIMVEYLCGVCGEVFESLEERPAPATLPHCSEPAPRTISAVKGYMKMASVTTGVNGPPPPNAVDTRPLADGVPMREYKAARKKVHRDLRIAEIRKNI